MIKNSLQADATSPCIRMCTLDEADVCLGCFRTIDEICRWGRASNDERRAILSDAERRRGESGRTR
jgi:predicted Fe-S protein YdhL (DUF1289 family)